MKAMNNSRGSVLIWTVVLAVLVELVLLYALSTFNDTRSGKATESRRLDVQDFSAAVEAVLADKNQCEIIVLPIVNRAASTVAVGSFMTPGTTVASWAQPVSPATRTGVALLSKIGPATMVGTVPQFVVDQTARTPLDRQAAGLMSVQTWRSAIGSGTAPPPSVATDFARRRVEPDPSISAFNFLPLSLAASGVYVVDLALIERPAYDDAPGFPRAFEIWAQMGRASDAPAGIVPGPTRLAEIAAVTGDYTSSGSVTGCVLRSVARAAPTDQALPNPFALSCPGKSILRTATITNPDGTTRPGATCVSPPSAPATCDPGTYLIGLNTDGSLRCEPLAASGTGQDTRGVFPPGSSCKRSWHRLAANAFYKRDDSGLAPATSADVVAFYGPDICKTWDDPGGYIFQPISGCKYILDPPSNLAGNGGGWHCAEFWCCHSY